MSRESDESRRVLVIRHAIAEDRDASGRCGVVDADRALTDKGIRRMRAAVAGLAVMIDEISILAHSPLRRARETAQIVAERFPGAERRTSDALLPDAPPEAMDRWLAERPSTALVTLVGHQPQLGLWLGRSVLGIDRELVELKKGAACLLSLPVSPVPGRARLNWLLPPKALRALHRPH